MNFAKDHWAFVAVAAYLLLFAGAVVGIQIWKIKRRHERPPVAFKLLRGPGETLRHQVAKAEENFLFHVVYAALVPVLAAGAVLEVLIIFVPHTPTPLLICLGISALVFLAALIPAGRWALRDLTRYRDDHLGYMGEREVAEQLQPLLADGYRVFHDVPAEGAKKAFNLDHVTVGPTGVALIETKARRKRPARPGFKDPEVAFDGHQLVWPWGENRDGIDQAINEADWLEKWIFGRTGLKLTVKPILTLPGWYVKEAPSPRLRVVNSKILADVVRGRGEVTLTPEKIDLIARQLDDRCRDVVD
jgi:hypothetical protein